MLHSQNYSKIDFLSFFLKQKLKQDEHKNQNDMTNVLISYSKRPYFQFSVLGNKKPNKFVIAFKDITSLNLFITRKKKFIN